MLKTLSGDRQFYKKLVNLTLPIALQSLMLASVAAADAFMLGRVDQNSMSAVSLATQIQFVQNLLIATATGAASLLGAQYWGKKDIRTIQDLFAVILKCCGIVSILFFAGCMFTPRFLMLIFTNEEVLIEIGIKYLRIAGWSYLFTGISQCYLTAMKVSDHAGMVARISSCAVIINIILNAVFIYGLLGVPAMGVNGAALATLTARIVEFVWCIAVTFRKDYIAPDFRRFFIPNKNLIKDFWKCGLPILGAMMFWGIGFTSYSAFMGHLGTDAAAANSVAAVVRDLVCCFCNGLATGALITIGNELGAGELEKARVYGDKLVIIAFICGFGSTAIMFAVTPLLMLFVNMTELAEHYLLQMMIVMAVYMIGRSVNTIIINGIFTAGGDTMFDFYSLGVTMWGMAIPLAALGTFLFGWPVWVIYACTCLDEVGKIPWVMYHYKKYKWVKDLTRKENE